jgi:hypothetical protein
MIRHSPVLLALVRDGGGGERGLEVADALEQRALALAALAQLGPSRLELRGQARDLLGEHDCKKTRLKRLLEV